MPHTYDKEEIAAFQKDPKGQRIKHPKWKGIWTHEDGTIKDSREHEIVPIERIDEVLMQLWKDPVTGFKGRDKLYETATEHYRGITKQHVGDFLKKNIVSDIHQPLKKQRVSNPIVVKQPAKHFQMDLITAFFDYAPQNNFNRNILTVLDLNTKYAFAAPLKQKTSADVAKALKTILEKIHSVFGYYPSVLQSDRGPEFSAPKANSTTDDEYLQKGGGKHVARLCSDLGIKQIFSVSYNPTTQGAIERFNGTIKKRLGQYFTNEGTHKWIDVLPKLMENYNNTVHSTTGKKPIDLFKRNADESDKKEAITAIRDKAATMLKSRAQNFPKLEVGDYVRVSLLTEAEERKKEALGNRKGGMNRNYSDQTYVISEILGGKQFVDEAKTVRKNEKYMLRTLKDGQPGELLKGYYYRDRLLRTADPKDQVNKPPERDAKDKAALLKAKIPREAAKETEEQKAERLATTAHIEKAQGIRVADNTRSKRKNANKAESNQQPVRRSERIREQAHK